MNGLIEEFGDMSPQQRELVELLLQRGSGKEPHVRPRSPNEAALATIWSEVLGVASVGIHDNFFDLGGDSILSMQVVSRAKKKGFAFGTRQLFETPTVAELASSGTGCDEALTSQEPSATVLLTPIQRWFFSLRLPNPNQWNLEAVVRCEGGWHKDLARQALQRVIDRNEALRLRVTLAGSELVVLESDTASLEVLSSVGGDVAQIAGEVNSRLDLRAGPVLRAVLVLDDDGCYRDLILVVHHLVCDWFGMRLLLDDLEDAYAALEQGWEESTDALPSYGGLVHRLDSAGLIGERLPSLKAWHEMLAERVGLRQPGDDMDIEESTRWVEEALSAELTAELLGGNRRLLGTQVHEVLLHAAGQAVADLFEREEVVMDVETHGRDFRHPGDPDLTHTVGWFAHLVPVLVERSEPGGLVKGLHQTALRWKEANALSGDYMASCYSVDSELKPLASQVAFNYLGQFGSRQSMRASKFQIRPADSGCVYAPNGERPHRLQVLVFILDGRLHFRLGYAQTHWSHERIAEVTRMALDMVRSMLVIAAGQTISPEILFADADLDAQDLVALFGAAR